MSGKLVGVKHKAYLGLGANLGDREATIGQAVELLAATPGIEVVAVSMLLETDPVGYADQPRFLNGVAACETELTPRTLLDRLLAVEQELGRVRGEGPRFGPRTIDLDLLLYGDDVVDEPGLVVPHPRLAERRFVLEPLHELDPDLTLPDGRRVADLLLGLKESGTPALE
jgi:2-amino-4-hydroxy-6-hydroxymethyldihydropteridine diphosphokinase